MPNKKSNCQDFVEYSALFVFELFSAFYYYTETDVNAGVKVNYSKDFKLMKDIKQ